MGEFVEQFTHDKLTICMGMTSSFCRWVWDKTMGMLHINSGFVLFCHVTLKVFMIRTILEASIQSECVRIDSCCSTSKIPKLYDIIGRHCVMSSPTSPLKSCHRSRHRGRYLGRHRRFQIFRIFEQAKLFCLARLGPVNLFD